MTNIQVSKDFFTDVYRLVALLDCQLDGEPEQIRRRLETQIEEKLDAQKRRELFTAYKLAEKGSLEREAAREAYLDRAEILPDWRTETENL